MRDLSFRGPPQLAVAENATTPTGVLGAVIWSTTAGKKLEWDGSKWAGPGSGAPGSGDVVGPASSVAGVIPVFDDTTGKVLRNSLFSVSGDGAFDPTGVGYYGLPGQSLRSNGPTDTPYWDFDGYPDMDCDEGVAFSYNVMVTTKGETAYMDGSWFPAKLVSKLTMPSGFWASVAFPSDPGDKIFFFSYDGSALRVAVHDLSAPPAAAPTILPVPSGLPPITGTNYVGTVSGNGMHFYVGINGSLHHITADSPGVLSTGSTVEGATIAEPGSGSMEQVLISNDGTGLLILDGTRTVHRYELGTPFSLASAGAPTAIPLDTAYTYYGMSYYESDGLLLFHHNSLGSADVVQSDGSLTFDATAYAQRTYLHSLTKPMPAVVVSKTPPTNASENQLWLDIS